ncbi:MAG: glycolate oxidase FAD binding subunit [Alphaproteobacteria bacterium]|nr:MAG: glycolate oxidase FAD binding subunit [Alphaproteobacteria bacterium]
MAVRAFYDWGGGLIWLAVSAEGDAGATVIRAAAKAAKGYATLMRAPDAVRAVVPVFEPESAAVAALTRRIKASVDPARLINPGLMHAGV